MVNNQIVFTKQAQKDAEKVKNNNLKEKVEKLLKVLAENPFKNSPEYKKLLGGFKRNIFQELISNIDCYIKFMNKK